MPTPDRHALLVRWGRRHRQRGPVDVATLFAAHFPSGRVRRQKCVELRGREKHRIAIDRRRDGDSVRGWYRRTAGVVEHPQPATWSQDIAIADDVVLA